MNAADCLVGPLDYSAASLCLAHNVKYVFVRRGTSVDEPFICTLLERHGLGLEMTPECYESGDWGAYLEKVERALHQGDKPPVYR